MYTSLAPKKARDDIRHQAISQYQPVAISATSRAKAPELNHPKNQMEEKAEGRQMKTQKCPKDVCPKCGKPARDAHTYECGSLRGELIKRKGGQSELCEARAKVARLKKQVEKLKKRADEDNDLMTMYAGPSWRKEIRAECLPPEEPKEPECLNREVRR